MLSSIVMLPSENSRYSFTIGNPDPTPLMYFFISSDADENPGNFAVSLLLIPGPWSANLIVFPLSKMETTTSVKFA